MPEKVRVLVVDDSAYMRVVLKDILESDPGIEVIGTAKDGVEAIEKVRTLSPKVVLLDIQMPRMDGLEVLHRIRENEKTKLLPVVILTTSSEDKDRIESYKLGVNSYIVKPVEFESFANVVSEIGFYWILLNKPPY